MDFCSRRINVVQVGLGTNTTFLQNLAGTDHEWDRNIAWLLEVVSDSPLQCITGVAIEPVREHIEVLRTIASRSMPRVALLQIALGAKNMRSTLHMLSKSRHNQVLRTIPWWERKDLKMQLQYLQNMSSVGYEHPAIHTLRWLYWRQYGVNLRFSQRVVEMWSWGTLASNLNFRGCELLILDTEGQDVKILRSLISHCQSREREKNEIHWPYVIQVETQGHNDKIEGHGAEWGIIHELEDNGYTLVHYSYFDSQLARTDALKYNRRIWGWATRLICTTCRRWSQYPYVTRYEDRLVYCRTCVSVVSHD